MADWKIVRKVYLGKNVLGERIYKIWKVKTRTARIAGIRVAVVTASSVDTVLETQLSEKVAA